MWAALLGFLIVEMRPLTHLLWARWHAFEAGEQWEYSSKPIPRVLHQTWKSHEPPGELLGYIESWQTHNPHLEYMLWNDTEGCDFQPHFGSLLLSFFGLTFCRTA